MSSSCRFKPSAFGYPSLRQNLSTDSLEEEVMPKKKAPITATPASTSGEESTRQPVSNQVRQLRRERKWTQWQLAQISRLSQRTIQRIERGVRMGITAELALASAFEVVISELYA